MHLSDKIMLSLKVNLLNIPDVNKEHIFIATMKHDVIVFLLSLFYDYYYH